MNQPQLFLFDASTGTYTPFNFSSIPQPSAVPAPPPACCFSGGRDESPSPPVSASSSFTSLPHASVVNTTPSSPVAPSDPSSPRPTTGVSAAAPPQLSIAVRPMNPKNCRRRRSDGSVKQGPWATKTINGKPYFCPSCNTGVTSEWRNVKDEKGTAILLCNACALQFRFQKMKQAVSRKRIAISSLVDTNASNESPMMGGGAAPKLRKTMPTAPQVAVNTAAAMAISQSCARVPACETQLDR